MSATADGKNGIRADLLLYSGEEDPHWLITKTEDISFVQRSLQHLPPAEPSHWPALGWRGFLLRGLTHDLLPGRVTVFKGTICILENDKEHCYRDQNKLEAWLQAQARRQGLGHLIPSAQ